MNKNITILTFHFNQNYGAVMQAYALQHFLKANGYTVSFPAYIPPYMRPSSALLRGIKSNGKISLPLVWQKIKSIPRRVKFHQFRKKHLTINFAANDLESALDQQKKSTAVIAGSDQVWNLNWYPGDSFDGYYFMEQLSGASVKKISYAACFGKKDQPQEKLKRAGSLITQFDFVFSRNQLTKSIAEAAAKINVPLVVDPTMLPGVSWPIRNIPNQRGKYVLIYSIDENQTAMAKTIATKLKEKEELKVIQVCSENAHLVEECDQYETSASPSEWLELIHNAEYMVTDSFHGCVFALKFGRKLIAYAEDWRSERIQDLLANVGLERCLFTRDSHIDRLDDGTFFDADRSLIQEKINAAGKSSADILLPCLEG